MDLSQQYKDEDHMGMGKESKLASHPASIIGEPMVNDKYKIL